MKTCLPRIIVQTQRLKWRLREDVHGVLHHRVGELFVIGKIVGRTRGYLVHLLW